ncbi:protein RETICULATA-RELATED 3, chloroplastic-like [Durio zibethinus]|uniref:Protein RETICULATA-RELATED 3, chloroplastic-like n=1 Tax=Durio zibethinus TaxID=66656 RepID=A0A6P5X0M3_DURZI|nr:protein RETICULATA-RELATED 3, chloroplastic-like [Durio zibethinus]XP_022721875.1 protein RETICULATA-RELATED 3, chloroplastic-like [Durio zibethinus]
MAAMARYRFSMLTRQFPNTSESRRLKSQSADVVSFSLNQPIRFQHTKISISKLHISCAGGGDGNNGVGRSGGGGGDDDSNSNSNSNSNSKDNSWQGFGILGLFLSGWRDRVAADPQFLFKVLMEELVGVTACVLGDMASRPNFGLNELDFVFSTLIVGSILNFTLMYLLAPTASASSSSLPAILANCPQSHMFEPGAYTLVNRFGTFVFKGAVFAAVGFAAGLVGTAISNGLIKMRKKMDPSFETPNKPPPTLLNALTWATHMGFSSNLRYQTLNGIEFLLAKGVPPLVFKSSVVVLRCLNNVLGGMSFVILARMTGSQSVEEKPAMVEVGSVADKEKLVDGDNLEADQSTFN